MKLGIIGFGRLGKLATKYLAQDFDLYVYDKINSSHEIERLGAKSCNLDEICKIDTIIPIVPMSEFENCIKEISQKINPNSLIIDVCSVKSYPVEVMQKYLPQKTSILATHPMFGPDSASDTLFGNKIVLCPVRINNKMYTNMKIYLERFGMKVIESTPEEHDKQIAQSLTLTHFLGRGLIEFGATGLEIDTKGYRRMMKILNTVQNDSWQLFEDMHRYNPYAQNVRDRFIQSLEKIAKKVDLAILN